MTDEDKDEHWRSYAVQQPAHPDRAPPRIGLVVLGSLVIIGFWLVRGTMRRLEGSR